MNKKFLGLFFIVLGLIIIFVIGYLVFYKLYYVEDVPATKQQTENNQKQYQNTLENSVVGEVKENKGQKFIEVKVNEIIENLEEDKKNDIEELKIMSESFVERFGSYSNHSNFSNIADLKIFMSDNMRDWADSYVKEFQGKYDSEEYYGIITKSITADVLSFDEESGQASIEVNTARQETRGENEQDTFYQKIIIDYVYQSGAWEVDKATWK